MKSFKAQVVAAPVRNVHRCPVCVPPLSPSPDSDVIDQGMPMGLGAGFKLKEKEREEREKDLERHRSSKRSLRGEKDVDALRSRRSPEDSPHEGPPSGWTSMIEDWLCNAGSNGIRVVTPSASEISMPRPLAARCLTKEQKEQKRGPYQLLTKDRMMGIYLAVYIHRDLRPFVQGWASHDTLGYRLLTQTSFRNLQICCHCRLDWWKAWE